MHRAPFTYDPLNTPKPLARDVWIVDGPVIHMSAGPLRLPFPTRMTILRLSNGDLWIHSPIALSDELRDKVLAFGPVRHLIAPNRIHYAAIQQWLDAFPDATSWGVEGIEPRAEKNGIPVAIHRRLGDQAPAEWSGQIDQLLVTSSFMSEAVFHHRPSHTAILTDLIENFDPARLSWPLRAMTWLGRNIGPNGTMPIDMRITFQRRRAHLHQMIARILAWKPEYVVMAHGDIYRTDATNRLRHAFRWLGHMKTDTSRSISE